MASLDEPTGDHFDVIIIGAGISGINAGYRVQTELPSYSYTILEARNAMGGTWDLFKYPGVRSDSDLHTFGFSWRPWEEPNAIAEAEKIKSYMKESAEMFGIDKKIQYRHKVISANWSTARQKWGLAVESNGEKTIISCRFVIFGSGYYNYDTPLESTIPGLDRFQGQIVHPQFWPEKLDYEDKKFIVIGSGATAITLVPSLVKKGVEKVTMLQRSPSYIISLQQRDASGDFVRRYLPAWLAHRIVRMKFIILPILFFKYCRSFPKAARNLLQKATQQQLPANIPVDPNFKPSYNPWDQRLCICPDGDFYKSLKSGYADVVTDHIETVVEKGIITKGGKTLEADVIVTATGLKLQFLGGTHISVDNIPIKISEKYLWQSTMLQDVPNLANSIGYANASWTPGADTAALLVCRLLKHMDKNGQMSAVPRVERDSGMKPQQVLDLNSTYITKAQGEMPLAGDVAPFLPRDNYLVDYAAALYGNITKGLEFECTATVGTDL